MSLNEFIHCLAWFGFAAFLFHIIRHNVHHLRHATIDALDAEPRKK